MHYKLLAGALSAALLFAAPAAAQWRLSTPLVINPVSIDPNFEMTAPRGWPLLMQPMTSTRAIRLESEAPAAFTGALRDLTFPAGTPMLGLYMTTGWAYCAIANRQRDSRSDPVVCYVDLDNDGTLDVVMDASPPLRGLAVLHYAPATQHPLPEPVPYTPIEADQGPSVNYAITFQLKRPRNTRRPSNASGPPMPATHIKPIIGFRLPSGEMLPLGRENTRDPGIPLVNGQTATIRFKGAEIRILGVNDDDSVRYQVVRSMPRRVEQIALIFGAY